MDNIIQDGSVLKHITKLTEREEQLYSTNQLTNRNLKELHRVKTELDQYWDILRQRRSMRDGGKKPGNAHKRRGDQTKIYEQFWNLI